jgi:hypothetical protein
MVDCTPFNIVVQSDRTLRAFDLEWVAPEPQPFVFVLFRGLLYTLLGVESVAQCRQMPTLIIHETVRDLVRSLGYRFALQMSRIAGRVRKNSTSPLQAVNAHVDRPAWETAQPVIRRSRAEMAVLSIMGTNLSERQPMRAAELEHARKALTKGHHG